MRLRLGSFIRYRSYLRQDCIMEWRPMTLLPPACEDSRDAANTTSDDDHNRVNQYSLLVLNQPILNPGLFSRVWNAASFRMAVDGGGNRWAEVKKSFPDLLYPHIVSGDMDSINTEVLQSCTDHGSEIISTPDQNETDFTKALRVFFSANNAKQMNISKAVAYCEPSGRLDQIMGNMETLFHAKNIFPPSFQLFLMGSTSLTWLLPQGTHKINCYSDTSSGLQVKYCSLIPIGSPCTLTTTGLKWNLSNDTLAFGKLVSTSNEIDPSNAARVISVANSEPIVWSMEFA